MSDPQLAGHCLNRLTGNSRRAFPFRLVSSTIAIATLPAKGHGHNRGVVELPSEAINGSAATSLTELSACVAVKTAAPIPVPRAQPGRVTGARACTSWWYEGSSELCVVRLRRPDPVRRGVARNDIGVSTISSDQAAVRRKTPTWLTVRVGPARPGVTNYRLRILLAADGTRPYRDRPAHA